MKPGAKYYEWEGARRAAAARDRPARRGGRRRGARPPDRRQEGDAFRWTGSRPRMRRGDGADAGRPARGRARAPGGEQHPRRHQGRSSSRTWRATGGFVYAGCCGRGDVRGARSRSRPRRRSASCPTRSSARRRRRRRACGADGPASPRRCGRRRTDRHPASPTPGCAPARRRALPGRRAARRTSPTQVGTPVYVYNAEAIRERYRSLDAALGRRAAPDLLRGQGQQQPRRAAHLRDLGAGADIVSAGELARALAAGFAPERIVFSGVGKAAAELRQAVAPGVGHLNVESVEELAPAGRDRRAKSGSTSPVGHPGQPRRHHRHPPLHLDRQERDQVRRAGRPGAGRRGVHRGPPAAPAHHARDAPGQPARRTPSRSARASAGCSSWRSACGPTGAPRRSRCSTSAAASGIRYADEPPMDPVAFRRGRRAAAARRPGYTVVPRARAVPGRERGRAPHRGALPEALRRQGVRGGGRRHERSGAAQPLPGLPRDRGARGQRAADGARRTWSGRCARPATSSRSTATLPDVAPATARRARRRRLRLRDGVQLQHAAPAGGGDGGRRPLVGRAAAGDGGGLFARNGCRPDTRAHADAHVPWRTPTCQSITTAS